MAFSKPESTLVRNSAMFLEGETVLTFQGPKMRKAQCIWVTVENNRVKYLVRHPSEGGIGPAIRETVTYPSVPLWRLPLPFTRPAPNGPRFWPRYGSSQISAAHLGIRSRGTYCQSMTLGKGGRGPRNLDPIPVGPMVFSKEPLYPTAPRDWVYEWIPEGSVLRFSSAYMKRDRYAYVLLQMAAEKKQGQHWPVTTSWSSDHCSPREDRIAGHAVPQLGLMGMGRGYAQGRGRGTWRNMDANAKPEKESLGRQKVQVHLPQTLRPLLVHDWELVTLRKKLFILPAGKTVDAILTEYAAFQPNHRPRDKKYAVKGLVALIKEYFHMVLGTQLLYTFEIPQYAKVLAQYPTCQMSQLYGGAHLLRLFQQLGPMLACSPLDDSSLNVLFSHLQDFLEYLAHDPSRLFTPATDYQASPAEYQQEAE